MPAAPDAAGVHPFTERFAIDLYNATPVTTTWELADPEQRTAFRDKARRFMAGDVSVLQWHGPDLAPRG